jgi:hypothetical protein
VHFVICSPHCLLSPSDVKNLLPVLCLQVRHLLKLSPEKWEEVAAHAQAAVMPDFRPRVWWCPPVKAGLLFSCKNGSVCMDTPIGELWLAALASHAWLETWGNS